MILDITADILEFAIKDVLTPIDAVLIVHDATELPDDYLGFIVQVRHKENTIMSNDGKLPVVSVYEAEVIRKVDNNLEDARKQNSGASLIVNLEKLQQVLNSILDDGLTMNIINVSQIQEDIATTETMVCHFTNIFDITVQPIIIEEE